MNTLEPVWKETALIAMPDVNGLLLLVRRMLHCYDNLFVYGVSVVLHINHLQCSSVFISLVIVFAITFRLTN